MAEERLSALRAGMTVVSSDQKPVGQVLEVFSHVGLVETFGEVGIPPQQEGHDPVNYAYSEAMPGAGDSYLTVRQQQGGVPKSMSNSRALCTPLMPERPLAMSPCRPRASEVDRRPPAGACSGRSAIRISGCSWPGSWRLRRPNGWSR